MGERRTGIAVSDPLGLMAHPVRSVDHQSWSELVDRLRPWVVQYQPAEIVVGLPRRTDGRPGGTAVERVQAACQQIRQLGVPVVLWDERFTTVTAQQVLRQSGVRGQPRRQAVDAVAAAVLLQNYLDAQQIHSRSLAQEGGGSQEPSAPDESGSAETDS